MIAIDTNVLVYAHREDSDFHQAAFQAMETLANGTASWSIPWPALAEFFAIVTHPRVFVPPTPREQALSQIDAWLESPSLVLLAEGEHAWPVLRSLIVDSAIQGPQVHDARIAALCLQHGVRQLWSADRDFQRFPALTVVNPLSA